MVKATELRIGSIISLFDIGKPEVISVISKQVVQIENGNGDIFNLKYVNPIPLTEEWLLKAGFEKEGGWYSRSGSMLKLFDISGKYFRAIYHKSSIPLDIEHIHQLQNLYYALTGKDLEIIKVLPDTTDQMV